MFAWLMACLTVQPSDISKLSREDFRFVVVGGKVRSIECEYFKGRADAFYNTRSLSTKKLEGKALLTYIEQTEAQIIPSLEAQKLTNIALSKGNSSYTCVVILRSIGIISSSVDAANFMSIFWDSPETLDSASTV